MLPGVSAEVNDSGARLRNRPAGWCAPEARGSILALVKQPIAACLVVLAVSGCATGHPESPAAAPAVEKRPSARAEVTSPSPSAPTDPAPPAPALAEAKAPPTIDLGAFEHPLSDPVHSFALGDKARVAAIGGEVWLDIGKGLTKLPRPPAIGPSVQIYFGRDDQPRLMGFERGSESTAAVYLRWRAGGWQRAVAEIGKLGGEKASPLFGVLGNDDPEVVCAPDLVCIIKRRTGWTTLKPPPGLPAVELCNGVPWALEGADLFRLRSDGWHPLETKPTFVAGDGVWANADDDVWVAEAKGERLHHFDGKSWTAEPAPLRGPRGLWGSAKNDVWLAADGGAAHFDGTQWSVVAGPAGPLRQVRRRGTEVWLGGSSGLWRGTLR